MNQQVRLARFGAQLKVLLYSLVLVVAIVSNGYLYGAAYAANPPPPVQQYYVPLPEDQVYAALKVIYPDNHKCTAYGENVVDPINTYISISVISDNTIIYYDHWEDGFEINVGRALQPTTEIWGDGNPANGAPPQIPSDRINADTVIVLNNPVNINTRQSVLDYDGGDRIAATNAIAITRAAWATGSSTLLAGAVEVYDTNSWGTTFEAPVGENINYNQIFEYSSLLIMAARDNTAVTIDLNGDGTPDGAPVTLNQGQSYHLNGGVQAGTKVTATGPVQVDMITGDVCSNYESRWYALFPSERWSSSYYNPVGTPAGDGTTVFLYNPSTTPLSIQWETAAGVQSPIAVNPHTAGHVVVPQNSGSHFYTANGESFMAIAAIDSDGPADTNAKADWGFTLVPERMLTSQILVGWGPGRNPLNKTDRLTENGSPVWVMPVFPPGATGAVNICVDYDGDDVGQFTDSMGLHYDQLLTLNQFAAAKVFDSDGDQTGMVLYICNMDPAVLLDYKLAAAWGQEPGRASVDEPGLDLGTTAPPAASFAVGKAADLAVDADQDGNVSPGDTLLYTIVIRNTARVPIENVVLRDEIPLHTSYVLNTTQFDNNGSLAALPDNGAGSPFPLDEGGINLGTLPVRGVFTVTFQALIDKPLAQGVNRVRNVAIVTANDEEKQAEVETPIDLDPILTIEKATNGQDADTPTGPLLHVGDPVTWTYVVRNTGPVTATNIVVTDNIAGVTPHYVSGDLNNNGVLEGTEVWTYMATGMASAGQYANIGHVQGTGPDGDVATAQDPSYYFGIQPAIVLSKSADQSVVPVGTRVTYSYTVQNAGNTPLSNITVTDDRCSPVIPVPPTGFNQGDANNDNRLDLTEQWHFTCAMQVTADITNTATATGVDPLNLTVSDQDDAFVEVLNAAIQIVKVASSTVVSPGEVVIYTYTVTNVGDDPLHQVTVVDDKCSPVTHSSGDVNGDAILALTEVWIYHCSAVITQNTTNVAVATGLDSFGNEVTDDDTATVIIPIIYLPIISVPLPPPTPCPPPDGCPIPGLEHPKGMAVHEGRNLLYMTSRDNDQLLVIEPQTNSVISQTLTGDEPWGVVVNEQTGRIYVSNYASGDVWIYAVDSLALLAKVPVGGNPALMAILPDLDTVFVVVRENSRVAIIQGTTLVQDVTAGGSGPFGIAADPVNQRVFVSNRDSGHLAVIHQVDGAWQTKAMTLVPAGTTPFALTYHAARNRLYVLYVNGSNNWFMDIWKAELNALWGRERTLAVGSGGDIESPDVGGAGLTVNPATGHVFNLNTADGTMTVISGNAEKVLTTTTTGPDPFPIAVNSRTGVIFIGLRSANALVKLEDTFGE
ncbi:MAG: hypothetical protein R3C14_18835 [Caldilineaceae bacterium]